ncbi:unnamed protein product [Tenebrio molitor]|nr:unnamed protein product [Tenebrio molitor]
MSFELKMNNIPKNPRLLALCGDHLNYTFEQDGYHLIVCGFIIIN